MDSTSGHPVKSLYAHVPFCARKCAYCAFYSEGTDGALMQRYVRALIAELELVHASLQPATVFFGGGTPSLLNLRQWEEILEAMNRLGLLGAAEWTIESNPATVSVDKARLWKSYGVNRVSLGVQSLEEDLLDRLGRIHSREMVFASFDHLRKAGIENINVDLMFGIPGQTMPAWRATLREALAMESEHLSCYEVIYEEDTPLFASLKRGEFEVDEDLNCSMYDLLVEQASQAGLVQYEIANFARDRRSAVRDQRSEVGGQRSEVGGQRSGVGGRRSGVGAEFAEDPMEPSLACRHNINYWRGGSYVGVGPSAAEYCAGIRSKQISNVQIYCQRLEGGERALEWTEKLPPLARAGEVAAFGLRMTSGWTFSDFAAVTGYDLRDEWADALDALVEKRWGLREQERFRLSPVGLRFADAAAEMFLR